MAKCRGCGKEIIFVKTPKGNFIPCNPSRVIFSKPGEGKTLVVKLNGEVISCTIGAGDDITHAVGVGYIPHWSTCKAASRFRKKKEEGSPLQGSLF